MRWWLLLPGLGMVLALGFGLGWLGRGGLSAPAPIASAPLRQVEAPASRAKTTPPVARSLPKPAASATAAGAERPEDRETAADDITTEEERTATLEQLRASGRDDRNLLGVVLSSFKDWNAVLDRDPKLDVKLGSWACFRGGCFVDAVHASSVSVTQSTQLITETESFLRWNSGKMRSGEIIRPDGKVEVTWVLFAPPEGEPVMQARASDEST
jgi:hypothetical protein